MNRGCLIALVAFGVCALLLFVLVIVVPLYMFDVIRSAPRVPVATFLTDDTVAVVAIDPNQKQFLDIVNQSGNNIGWILPYEVGLVVDLDSARKTRTVTFAGSPKHLGPAVMMMFGDKNFFPANDLETEGIDTWLTPALTREKGAIILRGTGAVDAKSEEMAASLWPEAAPRIPIKLEGGHAIEVVIQNHGGEGILALEPFFRVTPDDVEAEQQDADAIAEDSEPATAATPEAESQEPAPTNESSGDAPTPKGEADAVDSTTVSATGLLDYASEIRVVGDFAESGDFKLVIAAQAKDAENAALAKTLMDGLHEVVQKEMNDEEITVTSSASIAGNLVTGEFVFSGYKQKIAKWLQDMQASPRF